MIYSKRIQKLVTQIRGISTRRVASRSTKNAKDYTASLDVRIERGALVIRIGVQTLAGAVVYSDWAHRFDENLGEHGGYVRAFAIVDALQFAKDIASEMQREREDGSSPLTDMLDAMSEEAVNQGSLGLDVEDHCIKHGEKSPIEAW